MYDFDNNHFDRESEKYGLDTFFLNYKFPDLEKHLENVIKKLHSDLNIERKKYENELDKAPDHFKSHVNFYYTEDIISLEEKLFLIYEMIVINDYKELEIIIKKLLSISLDFDEKGSRIFDNSKSFLKNKGINFTEIKNYIDINDLRKVNNYLKHSKVKEVPSDLKQILEFRKTKELNYYHLVKFHKRVKDLRYGFIYDLRDKIYNYLYDFDDLRITNIAKRMIKRMDTEHVNLLIDKLNEMK